MPHCFIFARLTAAETTDTISIIDYDFVINKIDAIFWTYFNTGTALCAIVGKFPYWLFLKYKIL